MLGIRPEKIWVIDYLTFTDKKCMLFENRELEMPFLRYLLIITSIFIVSCTAANSNIKSIAAGDVAKFIKESPQAAQHPNSGASLLYSYTYVEIFPTGDSVLRDVKRYKIFNERGQHHAVKSISYREGYQEVKIFFANTIKPNGQVVPLDKKDIHDSSRFSSYDFYTDIREKRFTMPAVEDGCIIEYAYQIKNLQPMISLDYHGKFFFQYFEPIEEDIMEIVLPANVELKIKKFKNAAAPVVTHEGNRKKYTISSFKQKEIIPEPRMPALWDNETFPQLHFWTLDDWNKVSRWYMPLVKEQMQPDKEITDFTRQLIQNAKTEEEKIREIFNFVAQKVRYVAVLLGPYSHKPHAARDIFQKLYGDCKDKTVLLLAMLKVAGIEALPALVPANGEFFDETTPSLDSFNHVIAVVPAGLNKYYWLDATNEVASFDAVPFFRPTTVFLIKPDGSCLFVKTPDVDSKKDFISTVNNFSINQEGDAQIEVANTFYGKAAESTRYSFKHRTPEERKKFFERMGIEVKDIVYGSFTDTDKPFFVNVKGSLKNLAQKIDDKTLVLNNMFSQDTYKDITAAKERSYPVRLRSSFFARDKYFFKFPAGYQIKNLPALPAIDRPFKYRSEKFAFADSILTYVLETKNFDYKIPAAGIVEFKLFAAELQKRDSSIKSIIMEKK